MTGSGELPTFAIGLIRQLIRRGLPIGVDDCIALRQALAGGFGWNSREHLEDVCVVLWAKSAAEAEVIRAVFARSDLPEWDVFTETADEAAAPAAEIRDQQPAAPGAAMPGEPVPARPQAVAEVRRSGLTLAPPRTGRHDPSLIFYPQFPLSEREIAQTWRRLRRPVRQGPPVELDVDATLSRYARAGVVTEPVLVPARRNTARLVLLVDRQGSMTPYHGYVDFVCAAVARAGRLDAMDVAYFHNTAGRSADHGLLRQLPDAFQPSLDPVLGQIRPLSEGALYADAALTQPRDLSELLAVMTPMTGVVIISDAGASRRTFHTGRLLDSIAMVKAFRHGVVWLNPVPPARWPETTAAQLARHIPMFPLTREGLHGAVDVLRGRPVQVEHAL